MQHKNSVFKLYAKVSIAYAFYSKSVFPWNFMRGDFSFGHTRGAANQYWVIILIKIQGRVDHNTAKDFEKELNPNWDQCASGEQKK